MITTLNIDVTRDTVVSAECSIDKQRDMMGSEHDMYHKFYSSAHWIAEIDLLDMEWL